MQVSEGRISLRYEVAGGGHKAIVFLPALGTNCEVWEPQIRHFGQDYMLVCCETGGHYPLGSDSDVELIDYAKAVMAALDALGVLQVHVVGISMGGMVAQELAILAPERITSLVLASATSSYPPQARRQIAHRAEVARKKGMSALVEATLDRWFTPEFARSNPHEIDRIRQMLFKANPGAYASAAFAVSRVDTSDRLGAIAAPTLVLQAEYDGSMPPMSAEALARQIPAAHLEIVPDAAHLSNLCNPETFNNLIASFVSNLSDEPDSGAVAITAPW